MKPSALVVEDDETIREALLIVLDGEGYETKGVATLAEARDALTEQPFTVVVLDLMLPDGRGDELLDELATRTDAPPTLLVSASPDAAAVARRFGIACMTKPFDLDRLIEAVRTVISQQRSPSATPPATS